MTKLSCSGGTIPDFHDGFFDGLWISTEKSVHLFVRTVESKGFQIVIGGVKILKLSNIREGNIILDIEIVDTVELMASHIASAYEISNTGKDSQIRNLLSSARQADLKILKLSSSYGAEGVVLCKSAELIESTPMNAGLFAPS